MNIQIPKVGTMNKEKEHKRMGRPPVGVPEHIKKFRATEEEWKEFLELCPDDAHESFMLFFNFLKSEKSGIYEVLEEIEKAYPLDIFPDTTQAERDPIIKQYPGFIDRTSALMGRHLVKVIRQKLEGVNNAKS
jgi:hypothetical protein